MDFWHELSADAKARIFMWLFGIIIGSVLYVGTAILHANDFKNQIKNNAKSIVINSSGIKQNAITIQNFKKSADDIYVRKGTIKQILNNQDHLQQSMDNFMNMFNEYLQRHSK